jgi:putative addiction module component (TIGR02574 family)
MTEKAAQLLAEALQLSAEDRDEIAIELQESLEPVDDPAELAAYWEAELKRRIEDSDAGRTKGVPWEEVRRSLMEVVDDESAPD